MTARHLALLVKLSLAAAVVAAAVLFSANRTAANPSFGVGPGSLSGLAPGTIFNPAPGHPQIGPLGAPAAVISETALGLPAGSTVDDISFGDDPWPPVAPFFALFSVAQGSTGHPAALPVSPVHPDINQELSAVGDGSAVGDIYSSFNVTGSGGPGGAFSPGPTPAPCGPVDSNIQAADENGVGPWALGVPNVGLGLAVGDRLTKLELDDHSAVDFIPPGGDGHPDKPVFFTVDAATAATLPPLPPFFGATTAADVLAWDPSTSVLYDWAPEGLLGLEPGDDIAALKVGYVSGAPISAGWLGLPDTVVFSLKAGSPSLPGIGSLCFGPGTGTAGDVYEARGPFAGPEPVIDAEMLGLNTLRSGGTGDDALAAIDFVIDNGADTHGGDGYSDFQKLTLGKNPLVYCNIMRADVNMDEKVNLLDLGMAASVFGQTVPPAPQRIDQNHDNKINLLDLGAMASVFGKSVMACQ